LTPQRIGPEDHPLGTEKLRPCEVSKPTKLLFLLLFRFPNSIYCLPPSPLLKSMVACSCVSRNEKVPHPSISHTMARGHHVGGYGLALGRPLCHALPCHFLPAQKNPYMLAMPCHAICGAILLLAMLLSFAMPSVLQKPFVARGDDD